MTKGAKRRKQEPEPEPENDVPPGYLPSADPPRKNIALLVIAAAALAAWMLALVYLAYLVLRTR